MLSIFSEKRRRFRSSECPSMHSYNLVPRALRVARRISRGEPWGRGCAFVPRPAICWMSPRFVGVVKTRGKSRRLRVHCFCVFWGYDFELNHPPLGCRDVGYQIFRVFYFEGKFIARSSARSSLKTWKYGRHAVTTLYLLTLYIFLVMPEIYVKSLFALGRK